MAVNRDGFKIKRMEGTAKALGKLNSHVRKIDGLTRAGMAAAAAIIKAESMKKTPVEFGNLKASHYIVEAETKSGPVAEVGLTAEYAAPVHEVLEATHEVGEAKFLENAINENRFDILRVIASFAKITPTAAS